VSVIEAVTVTLYRIKNRPKGWRGGKPRRQKWLAYRDAAWAKMRSRCKCVVSDDLVHPIIHCRYHDKAFRAVAWPNPSREDPDFDGFMAPKVWQLPRSDEQGYWDYGRAVAYRLARFYRYKERER
jgi:hypothetical protein